MKTKLSLCIALLFCVVLLTGCSSASSLLGTWEYKISSEDSLYASSSYTFSKSGDEYVATIKMGSASETNSFKATYEIEGNNIIFTLENGNTITETYSLSGDTLTIDGVEYTKK